MRNVEYLISFNPHKCPISKELIFLMRELKPRKLNMLISPAPMMELGLVQSSVSTGIISVGYLNVCFVNFRFTYLSQKLILTQGFDRQQITLEVCCNMNLRPGKQGFPLGCCLKVFSALECFSHFFLKSPSGSWQYPVIVVCIWAKCHRYKLLGGRKCFP